VQLGAVRLRKAHIGQHVGLHVIHHGGELGRFGARLVGDLAPLCAGTDGIFLGRRGCR
jgi:hypothetical protein